ncbi:MAG: hypothetical protein ACLQF0_06770 [Dissulfurispiraceae bacterium]
MKLKTETNTSAMREKILRATKTHFGLASKSGIDAVFEHGQWWITFASGAQYSVVDAEGPGTTDGFDFEMVTPPDEG